MISPNMFAQFADDAAMIQAAVDEAAKNGDTVIIPQQNERTGMPLWDLPRSIKLYSGSNVVLDNACIRMADESLENFFVNSEYTAPICEENRQYDIRITGIGNAILDGGVHNGIYEYSFAEYDENGNFLGNKKVRGLDGPQGNIGIRLINVEGVTIKNLHIRNPRYWSIACYYCKRGHIEDIFFETGAAHPCLDGIDLRAGCSDFLIENIYGHTGDDTVALTTLRDLKDQNCGYSMDIHDIIIRNIHSILSSHCDMVRLLNQGGAKIYNVLIDGVFDLSGNGNEKRPLAAVRIGDLNDYGMPRAEAGDTYNITVRNVNTRARFGLYIAKTLYDSLIENVTIYDDGGIAVYANQCHMENVQFQDIRYTSNSFQPNFYIGYKHVHHRVQVDLLSGIYLAGCSGKNVSVYNLTIGKNLPYALAGHNTTLPVKADNITCLGEQTELFYGIEKA